MIKVGVSGHFCFRKELFNGQTIKTKMIADELEKHLGKESIIRIDTHGGLISLPRIIVQLIKVFIQSEIVIMLPAHNGIKIFAPLFVAFGKILRKKILYVVIGGWLPKMTKQKKVLSYLLKKFDGIYVEIYSMKITLEKQGFKNIFVMPNFKNLQILTEKELVYTTKKPFPFCLFSRVMKEKGIEDAIEAITKLNNNVGYTLATLDIYGNIDDNYKTRFEQIQRNFPKYIQYKGIVSPTESVNVLKKHFILLFPTYYSGEGFAGTLIDAMSAGIPVIASNWKYNKEIVIEGKTGILIRSTLIYEIKYAIDHFIYFNEMKCFCLCEAKKYIPQNAITPMIEFITNKKKNLSI